MKDMFLLRGKEWFCCKVEWLVVSEWERGRKNHMNTFVGRFFRLFASVIFFWMDIRMNGYKKIFLQDLWKRELWKGISPFLVKAGQDWMDLFVGYLFTYLFILIFKKFALVLIADWCETIIWFFSLY